MSAPRISSVPARPSETVGGVRPAVLGGPSRDVRAAGRVGQQRADRGMEGVRSGPVEQGDRRTGLRQVAGVVLLLVPGRRRQWDEHRGPPERGQLGQRSRVAAGDDHVRKGEDVRQLWADEAGHQVPGAQLFRQRRRPFPKPFLVAGPALVDHVGVAEQPRQDPVHQLVDLLGALRAAGDVHGRQGAVEAPQPECLDRFVALAGQHLRADRVAGHHGGGVGGLGQELECRLGGDRDPGRHPGQGPVAQAEADGLLVDHQRPVTHPGGHPDRHRDVAAGAEHHVRAELGDRGAGLRDAQGHVAHVLDVGRRDQLERVGGVL